MSKEENFALQFNFKLENDLYNVRVYNHDEAEARKALEVFAAVLPEIFAVKTMINSHTVVKESLGATQIPQQNNTASSNTGGKTCKHGAMQLKNGVNDRGPWKGWMCPASKETPDRCKAIYIRD